MNLRHRRNALLRSILSGEIEPLGDLPVQVQAWQTATIQEDETHNFTVLGTLANAGTLKVKLRILQQDVEYRLVLDQAPDEMGAYPVVAEGQLQPDGSLQFSLPKTGMSKGSQALAVWALDPVQQVGCLLHQKITLTLT